MYVCTSTQDPTSQTGHKQSHTPPPTTSKSSQDLETSTSTHSDNGPSITTMKESVNNHIRPGRRKKSDGGGCLTTTTALQLLPGAILLVVVSYLTMDVKILKELSQDTSPSLSTSLMTTTVVHDGIKYQKQPKSNHGSQTSFQQKSKQTGRPKATMPPQSSDPNMAGFVHIGKTGGSTISKMLRNGCSSLAGTSCERDFDGQNETIVSRLVERYYHVSDFWRLPTTNHRRFLISVRDAYDRTVSALLYMHPENLKRYEVKLTEKQKYFGPLAYKCFPTLESFATLLRQQGPGSSRSPGDCNYPYPPGMVEASDCGALACASIHGKVRFFSHLFFNYQNILDTKLPLKQPAPAQSKEDVTATSNNQRQLFVVRKEHIWDDWIAVNKLWGQPEDEPILIPSSSHNVNNRDVSSIEGTLSRTISKEGRDSICRALELEYDAYFRLLALAVNVGPEDIDDCQRIAQQNCPNLDIKSIVEKAKKKAGA